MMSALLLLLLVAYSNAAPAINYMTACERTSHTQCVINIGGSAKFRKECKHEEITSCLKSVSEKDICSDKDKESLPTIRRLIGVIKRKFASDPGFCASNKKFNDFVGKLQETFTVQGEGIEYTDPKNYGSGSGDSDVPDDTEKGGEDDDDDNNESGINSQNTGGNKKQKETKHANAVPKGSRFWKEKSKLILKGKNDRKVQNRVFYDDHSRRNKKTGPKNEAEVAKLQKAWDELKQRYERWYRASRHKMSK